MTPTATDTSVPGARNRPSIDTISGFVPRYVRVLAPWEEFVFAGTMPKNLAEGADGYLLQWGAVGLAVPLSAAVFAPTHSAKVDDVTRHGSHAGSDWSSAASRSFRTISPSR